MNETALRALIRLGSTVGTACPDETPYLPEPKGLTQSEIRQLVLELIG
ncbi:hypothetical protein QMO56_13625 [Roseomonas sp. E05]|nr:hypothetical protein [Roseomonas sp. E05]MDJ0389157.1 hypothetical protein [Roseomonas sp. E05]